MSRLARFGLLVVCVAESVAANVAAQGTPGMDMSTMEAGSRSWRWNAHGNVFIGLNDQDRKFKDFRTIELQNWAMGTGTREVGAGRLTLSSMLSLEPFTLKKIGSPQVFQTGETFQRRPLIDYQHPHDLFAALGASYLRPSGAWTISLEGDAVGSPALGPEPFMHRPSASENPQAPLSHHQLDSTHITPGVVSAGLSRGAARIEMSWFRGREPDEDRTDLDLGTLDSWSARGTWTREPWSAQVSGGHLHNPEITAPGRDITKLTASIAHTQTRGSVTTALFAAWGENREVHGPMDAYLLEAQISWLDRNSLYSRAELVTKDILNAAGNDPVGLIEFHPLSRVGAFTLGYARDLNGSGRNRFGVGADVTMYDVPANLGELRWAGVDTSIFAVSIYVCGGRRRRHGPSSLKPHCQMGLPALASRLV